MKVLFPPEEKLNGTQSKCLILKLFVGKVNVTDLTETVRSKNL